MSYISEETRSGLNKLLQKTFQGNSFSDNIAYNLDIKGFIQTEPIFHNKFAHAFTEFADQITTFMTKLGIRPVRYALEENSNEYENIVDMFYDIKLYFDNYRKTVLDLMDIAEMNGDKEIVVELENFWSSKLIYLKQVNIWITKAKQYENHPERFDKAFEEITII
jgi:ferritin